MSIGFNSLQIALHPPTIFHSASQTPLHFNISCLPSRSLYCLQLDTMKYSIHSYWDHHQPHYNQWVHRTPCWWTDCVESQMRVDEPLLINPCVCSGMNSSIFLSINISIRSPQDPYFQQHHTTLLITTVPLFCINRKSQGVFCPLLNLHKDTVIRDKYKKAVLSTTHAGRHFSRLSCSVRDEGLQHIILLIFYIHTSWACLEHSVSCVNQHLR